MLRLNKLVYEDFKLLLAELGASHVDSYVNAPLYYLLTGRKGAWVYRGGDAGVVTIRHPHLENCVMVFPELGRADFRLTAVVLRHLAASDADVRLARYTENDLSGLTRQLSELNQPVAIEVVPEDVMDWRYPVRVLDTARVAAMAGPTFEKMRNKYRRAAHGMSVTALRDVDSVRTLRAALRFWEGAMIMESKDTIDMSDFYHELFRVMELFPASATGLVFTQGRRPVGFSVWEELDDGVANMYVNLGDSTIVGLSDFQLVTSCRHLAEKGFTALNMGGSELASLDAFKAKYDPRETIDLYSAKLSHSLPDQWFELEKHVVVASA